MVSRTGDRQKPLYGISNSTHFPRSSVRPDFIIKTLATVIFLLFLLLISNIRAHVLAAFRRRLAHHYYYHAPLLRQGFDLLLWTPLCWTGVIFWLWVLSLNDTAVDRFLSMRPIEEEERLRARWEEWWRKEQDKYVRKARAEKRGLIMRGEWKGNVRAGDTDGMEAVKWFT